MLYMQHEGMNTPCSCIICGVGEKDCDLAPFTPVGSWGPPPGGLPPTPGGVHLRRKGPYRRPRKPTESKEGSRLREVRSQAKCPGDLRAQSRALKATELAQGPLGFGAGSRGSKALTRSLGPEPREDTGNEHGPPLKRTTYPPTTTDVTTRLAMWRPMLAIAWVKATTMMAPYRPS